MLIEMQRRVLLLQRQQPTNAGSQTNPAFGGVLNVSKNFDGSSVYLCKVTMIC
jgi:hypothetical protein